ncbi:hypothetical protein GS885_25735 [Rhodococcus hoagii]|nr:hypothetical protein [Prescottella equi]NKR90328.1 hypothetical protein [Prescottella equi]NKR90372.1 hypothetical protein [Prescottella equi]NKT37183.1 hypothetical protein [Prescottella equi]NKT40046.1 hypothetical protein [Prescottella equi]
MGEAFAALPIEGGVAVGIVLGVLLMVARGALVPGPQHREAVEDRDRQIERLYSALNKALTLNEEDAKTIATFSSTSALAAHLLEEFRKETSRGSS